MSFRWRTTTGRRTVGYRPVALLITIWLGLGTGVAGAEWYVAGQFGLNFADRLTDISGTNSLANPSIVPRFEDFDLQNSFTYGAKVGYFPGHGWFGIELDAFHTNPHIKQHEEVPGIHLRVTTVAVNFIARYPGVTWQPYAGVGAAAVIGRIGNSPTNRSDTDVGSGLNLIAGLRAFVTPYVAVFTEYKFTQATLRFDEAFGSVGGFVGDYKAQHVVVGLSYHF
ncbi:outer membrane protein [Candidatus Nitrospira bockiana]